MIIMMNMKLSTIDVVDNIGTLNVEFKNKEKWKKKLNYNYYFIIETFKDSTNFKGFVDGESMGKTLTLDFNICKSFKHYSWLIKNICESMIADHQKSEKKNGRNSKVTIWTANECLK